VIFINSLEEIKIKNLIYAISGKQVMLDKEISATKCHHYLYDKIITHYDISKRISTFNNFIMGGKIIWN
jgi:hypothetical protein